MKRAADFRAIARGALRRRWFIAVMVTLVAGVLGGTGMEGPEIKFHISESGANANLTLGGQTIFSTGGNPGLMALLAGGILYIVLAALVIAAVWLFLGSVVGVGYSRFTLQLADGNDAGFENLFQYFPYWKNAVCTRLLTGLYIFLWTLLLIIPGIIASYSYAMTGYILAEHPELTAGEAIAASKEMMAGNRWRLFCLHLSFIGWALLCTLTLGIGNLWLNPYMNVSEAAFYREISETERRTMPPLESGGYGWDR